MRLISIPVLFLILGISLLTGCGQTAEQPTLLPTGTETLIPATPSATSTPPEPTAAFTEAPLPTETATLHPIGTLSAVVTVENLNLRSGPGTTYAILGSYPANTELFVTARVPGNEWVRVKLADDKTGWMSTEILGLGDEVAYLPLEDVTDSIVVTGRIIDSDGNPINLATVAVMQRLTGVTLRTDAITDQDGYWYAYLPKQSSGIWETQVVGVDCKSWIYDGSCNIANHFLYNYRFIFQPPPLSPFLFMFQISDARITGEVTNAEGVPVSMRVFAERSDGAYVYVLSNQAGQFTLPVGAGVWKVYSMQYNPNLEGESVSVKVEAGVDPEPVAIKAPVKKE